METPNQSQNNENTAPKNSSAVTIADRLKDLFRESPVSAEDSFQHLKEPLFKRIKNTVDDQLAQKQQLGGPGIS
jgi:hypothetical protein